MLHCQPPSGMRHPSPAALKTHTKDVALYFRAGPSSYRTPSLFLPTTRRSYISTSDRSVLRLRWPVVRSEYMLCLTMAHTFAGNAVTANVATIYPFSDTLTTTITAQKAFTFKVRIPSWTVGGTISVNGGQATAVAPVNGLHSVNVNAGTTKIALNLPAQITIGQCFELLRPVTCIQHAEHVFLEQRPNSSIAIHRGVLHYAFDIPRNQTVLAQNAQQPLAVDLQFEATQPWAYAIDPTKLTFNNKPPAAGTLPSPIFDSGLSPLTITAVACPINWPVAGATFAASPPVKPACTGPAKNITLSPFGVSRSLL
jgi:hypothetical protein